jgi:drug/metabolite transporter (DMT)-like permease
MFAVLCLIWSTTWAAIRVCEQGFSPLWAAALRFVMSALLLLIINRKGARSAPSIAWWILPLAGLANALSYGLIFIAEKEITGGTAAVLAATNPFATLGAAVLFGYERATLRKILGLTIGFVGVLLLVGVGVSGGSATAVATVEVLLSVTLLWPAYAVLMRRAGDAGWTPSQVATTFILWTAVFLAVGAPLIEGKPHINPTREAIGALLYLALVGTVLAWSLYTHLLSRLPMTVLQTMLFIEPAVALGIDWLLGERSPSNAARLGAVLIIVGVILSAVGRQGKEQPAVAPPLEA